MSRPTTSVEGISQSQEKKEPQNQPTLIDLNVTQPSTYQHPPKTNEESVKTNNNDLNCKAMPLLIYTKNNTETNMISNQIAPVRGKPVIHIMSNLVLSEANMRPIISIQPPSNMPSLLPTTLAVWPTPNIAIWPPTNFADQPSLNIAIRPPTNLTIQPPTNSIIRPSPNMATLQPTKSEISPSLNISTQPLTNSAIRPSPNISTQPPINSPIRPDIVTRPLTNSAFRPSPNIATRLPTNSAIRPSPNIAIRPQTNSAIQPSSNKAIRPPINSAIKHPSNIASQPPIKIAPQPPPKIAPRLPALSIRPSPKIPTWLPPNATIQSAPNLARLDIKRVENAPNNTSNPQATKSPPMPSKRKMNQALKPIQEGNDTNLLKLLMRPPARTKEPTASSTNPQTESNSMPMLLDLFEPPPLVPTKQAMAQQNSKNLLVSQMKIMPSIIKKRCPGNMSRNENSYPLESNTMKERPKPGNERPKPVKERPKPVKETPKPVKERPKPVKKERKPSILRNTGSKIEVKTESNNKDEKAKGKNQSDPGFDLKLENIYIADGLKDDFENLICKCLQVYKLNYEKFSEIWKQMNFSCIFHGRQSSAEIAELSEEAIHIAKAYMVARNVNYEENVAGLFIVYALLNFQPYEGFAALRLVPSDVPAIKALELEARKQRRHDVLYILGAVLVKGPCQFHVAPREVALEMPIRKYHDGSIHTTSGNREGTLYKNREVGTLLKELITGSKRLNDVLQKIEKRLGEKIVAFRPKIDKIYHQFRGLNPDTVLNRDDEMEDEIKVPTPEKTTDRQDMVAAIKQRAMVNVVEPMRHLTGIDERQSKSLTPPTPTANLSDTESKAPSPYKGKGKGKGKGIGRSSAKNLHALFDLSTYEAMLGKKEATSQSLDERPQKTSNDGELAVPEIQAPATPYKKKSAISPSVNDSPCIKTLNSDSDASKTSVSKPLRIYARPPKKRKENAAKSEESNAEEANARPKQAVKKRRKKTHLSSNESDSDIDLDEIDNIPLFDLIPRAPTVVNGDESHNQIPDKGKLNKESKGNDKPQTELASTNQELDLQLDTIPEIHSTDKNIVIEVIDNFKANETIQNAEVNMNVSNKRENKETDEEDGTFKKRKTRSDSNLKPASLLKPDQIEARVKRKEKREFKRIRIKSKFKKLGILSVANFDDSKVDLSIEKG